MWSRPTFTSFATLVLAASHAAAQTFTNCDPLNVTCPADVALGTTASFNWTNSATPNSDIWNTTAGTIGAGISGAEFTITSKGDSPTIQSNFYIFFGRVSVVMKAANGQGIVSSVVLQSDDLDEVDWEFIGGNTTYGETNYFGKGNTTTYNRAIWYPVDNTLEYHNYTTHWTAEQLQWYIDGVVVRTLNYSDAVNGTQFPQTPCFVKIGIWAGGDPTENSNGTVEWAGGDVDYSDGPFTMVVQSLEVEDFSSGSSYTYGDKTGDWSSIKIASGNSTIADNLKSSTMSTSLKNKYESLPRWAQIVIAAAVIGVAAIAAIVFIFYCIKSRRAGKKERLLADQEWEKDLMEMNQYKQMHVSEKEIHGKRVGDYI